MHCETYPSNAGTFPFILYINFLKEIKINDRKSDSPDHDDFKRKEGESFEVQLYHNDSTNTTLPVNTEIGFKIEASTNDGGGFNEADIASIEVAGITIDDVELIGDPIVDGQYVDIDADAKII